MGRTVARWVLTLSLLLGGAPAFCAEYRVADNPSFKAALDAAANGDRIVVTVPGSYYDAANSAAGGDSRYRITRDVVIVNEASRAATRLSALVVNSSPEIRNFTMDASLRILVDGAGVAANPRIVSNVLHGTVVNGGGAMVSFDNGARGTVTLEGNVFQGARATGYGGAWAFFSAHGADGSVVLRNSLITVCSAESGGAVGVATSDTDANLTLWSENNVSYGCVAGAADAEAIRIGNDSRLTATFVHDTASNATAWSLRVVDGAEASAPASVTVVDSILRTVNGQGIDLREASPAGVALSHSDFDAVAGSYADGGGNLTADPLFLHPYGNSLFPLDYHLKKGSPCLGAGVAVEGATVDANGRPWLDPPAMGAYEYAEPVPGAAFASSYLVMEPGGSAVLSWSTADATTATLDGQPVELNGSRTVSPSQTTTYTLVATGPGGSATATATVNVWKISGAPIDYGGGGGSSGVAPACFVGAAGSGPSSRGRLAAVLAPLVLAALFGSGRRPR